MGSLAAVLMAVKVARAKISYILITELGFSGKFEVVSLIECISVNFGIHFVTQFLKCVFISFS